MGAFLPAAWHALFATLNVTSLAFVAISIARIASASAAIKLIDQVRKL
jgi:hypothetical protein